MNIWQPDVFQHSSLIRDSMREKEIFNAAIDLPPDQRSAYLDQACGDDRALRQSVEQLLSLAEDTGEFTVQVEADIEGLAAITEGPGSVIGPYTLVEKIGEGGMGLVFAATQTEPVKRNVALKIIRPGLDTHEVINRFRAERTALAAMDHPSIARVLDAGATETGRPYFVMELVDGLPITTFCDRQQMNTAGRLSLFIDVCRAIQHAHSKSIIHRDIKPSNVLVTVQDGKPVPKVIDFGVAKALDQDERIVVTRFAQIVGTPLYMSPEQADPQAPDIDTRSDIYSLGVLLYEMLTGSTPHDRRRLREAAFDELRRIIREEEPQKPSTRISTLGDAATSASAVRGTDARRLSRWLRGDLDWIVMKALDKDRNRRYETATGFGEDIQRFLNNEPVMAGPPSSLYRVQKLIRRNRTLVAIAATIVLLLVAGVAGTSVGLVSATRANRALDASLVRESDARATAVAMNDFLVNLLRTSTPEVARGKDIPVSEVVQQALENLDEEFVDQPRVRLKLREVLSDVMTDLGRAPEAEAGLRRAVQEAEQTLGPDDEVTLGLLNEMAKLDALIGNLREAVEQYRSLLSRTERIFGLKDRRTLTVVQDLATTLADMRRYEEAEPLYRRALKDRAEVLGPTDRQTLESMSALANTLQENGQPQQAIDLSKEAYQKFVKHFGADHPATLYAASSYAGILWSNKRLEEAEPIFREIDAARQEIYGAAHPDTLANRANLALVLDNQERYEEAAAIFRDCYEKYVELFGREHFQTIVVANNLATSLEGLQRYDEAAEIYETLIPDVQASFGEGHEIEFMIAHNLATMRVDQGQPQEARRVATEALDRAEQFLGRDGEMTAKFKELLAELPAE